MVKWWLQGAGYQRGDVHQEMILLTLIRNVIPFKVMDKILPPLTLKFNLRDLQRSLDFYLNILGFEIPFGQTGRSPFLLENPVLARHPRKEIGLVAETSVWRPLTSLLGSPLKCWYNGSKRSDGPDVLDLGSTTLTYAGISIERAGRGALAT